MNAAQLVAWLRALAWAAIAVVVVWVLTQIHYTMGTFGLAAAISYLLYPIVNWLFTRSTAITGRQLSWGMSVLLVYITLPILLGVVLYLMAPGLTAQVETMGRNFPTQSEHLQDSVKYWSARFEKAPIPAPIRSQINNLITNALSRFNEIAVNFFGYVANGIINILTWVAITLIALIISQFMLLNLPEMRRSFYEGVPQNYRDEVQQVVNEVNLVLGGFVKGTVMLTMIASLLVFGLLSALAVPAHYGVPGFVPFEYSLVLALLTLVLYPIPILGLIAITLIGAFAAYFQMGSNAMYIVSVVFIVCGAFTAVDRVVGPRVMSKAMGVSPLFVMFAAFAGAELMGFWGMILGVPMAAAIKVLFRYVRARFLVPQSGDLSAMIGSEPAPSSLPPVKNLRAADHVHSTVSPAEGHGYVEPAEGHVHVESEYAHATAVSPSEADQDTGHRRPSTDAASVASEGGPGPIAPAPEFPVERISPKVGVAEFQVVPARGLEPAKGLIDAESAPSRDKAESVHGAGHQADQ